MWMIIAIISGIIAGLAIQTTTKKEDSSKVLEKMDHLLLVYLFPILLMLIAMKLRLNWSQAKVTSLMAVAMTISFGFAWLIAKWRLKLGDDEHGSMLRNGFLVLAVCSNTGHGVMLASSATTSKVIEGLLMGPMYMGFICVIFLPMFLVDRGKVGGFMKNMILWHPVSYGAMAGFLTVIDYSAGWAWMAIVGTRIIWKYKDEAAAHTAWQPFVAIFAAMMLARLGGHLAVTKVALEWYPMVMLFLTAITIGIKIRGRLEASHWAMVRWIILFGLIVAPAIALSLALATRCSYEEAFVLVYSISQPPAYLGMLWLRAGKFGKDFSISEKSFAIQAIIAYTWGIVMPHLLKLLF